MPDRVVPCLAVVGSRCEIDLDAVLVEGKARERHQVLPADQTADRTELALDRLEPVAVAEPPDEAFVVRGHQLAVVERQLALWLVDEQRVVDRSPLQLVRSYGKPQRVRLGDR